MGKIQAFTISPETATVFEQYKHTEGPEIIGLFPHISP